MPGVTHPLCLGDEGLVIMPSVSMFRPGMWCVLGWLALVGVCDRGHCQPGQRLCLRDDGIMHHPWATPASMLASAPPRHDGGSLTC